MSSSIGNAGKKPSATGGRGGFRTLDINRGPSGFPGAGGSGSDSDEPQEYYTGGEKSGMIVQDPTMKNSVDSIFEQARQMGAQQVPVPPLDGQSSTSRSFTGTGRLLSGDAQTAPSVPQPPQDVLHNIHFWNNGFTKDDGPLRGCDDPESADFMEGSLLCPVRVSLRGEAARCLSPSPLPDPSHIAMDKNQSLELNPMGTKPGPSTSRSASPTSITAPPRTVTASSCPRGSGQPIAPTAPLLIPDHVYEEENDYDMNDHMSESLPSPLLAESEYNDDGPIDGGTPMPKNRKRKRDIQLSPKVNAKRGKDDSYKNQLQKFSLKKYKNYPVYITRSEGEPSNCKFYCCVEVDGQQFKSAGLHLHKKDAEQDAAKIAYHFLMERDGDNFADLIELIDKDLLPCKSLLHDFSRKMQTEKPSYSCHREQGPGRMTLFAATVCVAGNEYRGELAISKNVAAEKAARIAVKSILATNHECMLKIFRSKRKVVAAIPRSLYSKEGVANSLCEEPVEAQGCKKNEATHDATDAPSSIPKVTVEEPTTPGKPKGDDKDKTDAEKPSNGDDSESSEDVDYPRKKTEGKNESLETSLKTPQGKKAKIATPSTGNKTGYVHVATSHPGEQAHETSGYVHGATPYSAAKRTKKATERKDTSHAAGISVPQ